MELKNFTPAPNAACANAKVCCVGCQAATSYGNAFHAGWKFAPAGVPFVDYFCPVCAIKHEKAA